MQVAFITRENGPERLVCEAEILFGPEAGPLAGMKLAGFSVWRSPEGEHFVTFPARAFGVGSDRRFFDFLRAVDGDREGAKRVKAWILAEYEEWRVDPQPLPLTAVAHT